ncbi:thiosulfate oxidation carrier protein SoxY [Magnetococcales bacterium HHB-1]
MTDQQQPSSRRAFFKTLGHVGMGAAALSVAPMVSASATKKAAIDVDADIKKNMGGGAIAMEKVSIEAPTIAENGKVVPVKVNVEHPMTKDNYIESIALFVDKNPIPMAFRFQLSPASGKAFVAARIKMGKTSQVRAIAKTNKGKLYGVIETIKVTIGGCGG